MRLPLFDEPMDTIASPLCVYERCAKKGRAVLGPPQPSSSGASVTRHVACLQCGRQGWQSTNTAHADGRFA